MPRIVRLNHFQSILAAKLRKSLYSPLVKERPASLPFLSGDLFRSISHFRIDTASSIQAIYGLLSNSSSNSRYSRTPSTLIIYISASLIGSRGIYPSLLKVVRYIKDSSHSPVYVIIHNGDINPHLHYSFLSDLSAQVDRLYSVNATARVSFIRPLPIGLENLYYMNHGITSSNSIHGSFHRHIFSLLDQHERRSCVYASFSLRTNLLIRQPLQELILSRGIKFYKNQLSRSAHSKMLLNSMFCISPPGNGSDCHRTWEAIYHGCIPVVLKSEIHPEFSENLPILAVNTYDDFFDRDLNELSLLYAEISSRDSDLAYAEWWVRHLCGDYRTI